MSRHPTPLESKSMKKIPTLFVRDPDDMSRILREVHPDCKWVADGEGMATRKYDGTCVMLDADGRWWARREVKPGKLAPSGFVEVALDDVTGKSVGWEPIDQSAFVKLWQLAMQNPDTGQPTPGTYELCGPQVNQNPEKFPAHVLVHHGVFELDAPRDYDELRTWLAAHDYEGIVWHHRDGRMAKIKRRDFKSDRGA